MSEERRFNSDTDTPPPRPWTIRVLPSDRPGKASEFAPEDWGYRENPPEAEFKPHAHNALIIDDGATPEVASAALGDSNFAVLSGSTLWLNALHAAGPRDPWVSRWTQEEHGIPEEYISGRVPGDGAAVRWTRESHGRLHEGAPDNWDKLYADKAKQCLVVPADTSDETCIRIMVDHRRRYGLIRGETVYRALEQSSFPQLQHGTDPHKWPKDYKNAFPRPDELERFDPRSHSVPRPPWTFRGFIRDFGDVEGTYASSEKIRWEKLLDSFGPMRTPDEFRRQAMGALILPVGAIPLPLATETTLDRENLFNAAIHFLHVTSGIDVLVGSVLYPCHPYYAELYEGTNQFELGPVQDWQPDRGTPEAPGFEQPAAWGQEDLAPQPEQAAAPLPAPAAPQEQPAAASSSSGNVVSLRERMQARRKRGSG